MSDEADYMKFNRMGYIGRTAYAWIKEHAKDCKERERVEHLLALAWIEGVKDGIDGEYS